MQSLQIPTTLAMWILNDKENDRFERCRKVAKESGNYKTDKDGNFHIAKSYGPEKYAEGDRSRTYAGITLLIQIRK